MDKRVIFNTMNYIAPSQEEANHAREHREDLILNTNILNVEHRMVIKVLDVYEEPTAPNNFVCIGFQIHANGEVGDLKIIRWNEEKRQTKPRLVANIQIAPEGIRARALELLSLNK